MPDGLSFHFLFCAPRSHRRMSGDIRSRGFYAGKLRPRRCVPGAPVARRRPEAPRPNAPGGDPMSRTPAATTTEFLPFARPSITALEREAVLEVLDSGWLTTGPRTKEFEARFAETVGSRH